MIVIKVEIWPYGDASKARSLGVAVIVNDGTGRATSGNYSVHLSTAGDHARKWKSGKVKQFPRKKLLAWDLIYRALGVTIGDRNKEPS